MKKRLLAAILMCAMALSLVACGGNASNSDSQSQSTNNAESNAAQESPEVESESDKDSNKIEYKVTVVDAAGNPVEGKMVQFCNAHNCFMPVPTDADGVAVMKLEEASDYKAKEVTQDENSYVYFEDDTEITITIAE